MECVAGLVARGRKGSVLTRRAFDQQFVFQPGPVHGIDPPSRQQLAAAEVVLVAEDRRRIVHLAADGGGREGLGLELVLAAILVAEDLRLGVVLVGELQLLGLYTKTGTLPT